MRTLLIGCLLFDLAVASSAQGKVWVVDDTPGTGADFADIQPAINSATVSAGDVLLVKPGAYGKISCQKALTIQADSGGTVTVGSFSDPHSEVRNIGAGKMLRLRGSP